MQFTYTIAVVLGAKMMLDGFFLADIFNHVTQEFPLTSLAEGEKQALEAFQWGDMNRRVTQFRNALLNVALEAPPPHDDETNGVLALAANEPELHVLIVDDSAVELEMHTALVRNVRPTARIHACAG